MAKPSPFYNLSINDWERIAFYAVASENTFLGPPTALHALSLVSRHVHMSTSVQNNSRLYARIFRFKFDYAAPARRLSERWLTTRCLAQELIARFSALRRIRGRREFRPEDLWSAYIMMSESDGKNESQLLDWADLKGYLEILIVARMRLAMPWNSDVMSTSLLVWLSWMTTSRSTIAQEQAGYDQMMLMFLRPFVSSGYRVPSIYGPDSFFNLPLCEGVTSTPTNSSGPSPPCAKISHFSHKLVLAVPIITSAATLLTTVYTEALQTLRPLPPTANTLPADRATANALGLGGPTYEDLSRFHFLERIHASTRCTPITDVTLESLEEEDEEYELESPLDGSWRYEEDWSRLVNCHDPRGIPSPLRGKVHTIGSLAGSWEGRLILPDFLTHINAIQHPDRSPSVQIQHKPLYWNLREHHCLTPDTPLNAAIGDDDEDFLNAWLPPRTSIRSFEDAIEVSDPDAGLHTRYETFIPGSKGPYSESVCETLETPWIPDIMDSMDDETEFPQTSTASIVDPSTTYIDDDDEHEDTLEQKSSGVCDILITGETSQQHGDAWGHYKIIGRVRPWDGLIVLLRSPRDPEQAHLGEWVFKGYLHDQNLVGRWREKFVPVTSIGFEGAFVNLTDTASRAIDSEPDESDYARKTRLKISHRIMSSNPDVPPFTGYVETTLHALRLIHAARQGVIPRITRRLNDSERRTMIKAGAVFVFSVEESGIKRWTDGLLWSPSRIVGNFLVYREINERTSSRGSHKKSYPLDPPSRGMSSGRRNSPDHSLVAFRGSGHLSQSHGTSDPGAFKINGLIKKTITVTIEGSDLHLISYYTSEDIRSGRLKRPTSRPDIMGLAMPPHIFRLTNFRVPPKVEIGPDGKARLVCEGEDLELPTLECKVEEPAYHVSDPPHWASGSEDTHRSPRLDASFGEESPLYSQHQGIPSPTLYTRESTVDRWPTALENLRIVPVDRQDFAGSWSPSPSPTHPHNALSRRRDTGPIAHHQPSSWSAGHSQTTRWRSDPYPSATGTSIQQLDRSRVRSNTVFENSNTVPHRRDSESGLHYAREGSHQRPPWTPRETTSAEKYSRPQPSFTNPSPASPFPQHQGYHRMTQSFGTSWHQNDSDASPVATTLHSTQTHSLPGYEAPYLASSPEGFSNVDEYGDA
ncbi:hypothetical protein D9615_005748 [Tricholomella constricta]|uniref:cAMP-independent regulatory protein pac2 n=1 Tax=Tricholomella constricta TaxID=117010 RepID=A0A8H5M3R4_9AGAR|nr:hypothetical protein D9615_005748 [Tricholomella constricta]